MPASAGAGILVRAELARVLLEHHRNIVAYRKGKPVGPADQFFLCLAINQRPLAKRADQNVKKP